MNSLSSQSSSIHSGQIHSGQIEDALKQTPGPDRWNIRLVRPTDIYALSELITGSFHSRAGMMGWAYPFMKIGVTEDLRQRLRSQSPHYLCLIAEEKTSCSDLSVANCLDDPPLGTVEMALKSAYPFRQHTHQWYYLSNLAVQENYRRQGIAQKLLAACEQIASMFCYQDLYLHVLEDNYRAQSLYEKQGYRFKRVDPDWSALLLQRPRRLLLHKQLDLPKRRVNC